MGTCKIGKIKIKHIHEDSGYYSDLFLNNGDLGINIHRNSGLYSGNKPRVVTEFVKLDQIGYLGLEVVSNGIIADEGITY